MSTMINGRSTDYEPTIGELLASWQETAPPMTAPDDEVAVWFERSVHLLAPITRDPAHPQHTEACALAAENAHDAAALREATRSKGAMR